jgi:hypothetical protein
MEALEPTAAARAPWNKGKLVGQKTPLKLKEIWAIRIRLQLANRRRELALFNLAIDSKLRACDLVRLKVRDVCHGQTVASRTTVLQQKTQRAVQLRLRSRHGSLSGFGSVTRDCLRIAAYFQADSTARPTYPPASTLGSWIPGSDNSDWTRRTTGRIRSGKRRQP